MWMLSQTKKMLTNGQLTFTIDKWNDENNKDHYYIMLNDSSVASYSTKKICEYVLILLADFLNENEKHCFKFPSEEQIKEIIKNDIKKNN